jgi:electron transfer DM13
MPLLNVFGELERFTTEELYPLRYVITPLLIALGLAVLYAAYRTGMHLWIRSHLAISAVVGVPLLVAGLYAGDYLLSPLWERSYLEEESPLAASVTTPAASSTGVADSSAPGDAPGTPTDGTAAPDSPSPSPTTQPAQSGGETSMAGGQQTVFQVRTVVSGTFVGADDFHFGRGEALIIETEPGVFVLRFENFSVRNGPDLYVYLSEDPAGENVDEALNLGGLKATDGAFNYEIPAGIDVSRVKSAVVWCRQFTTLFTHAELR